MKALLIATTALVCVTSFAAAGTLPERQADSRHSGVDTNQEFLCTYGFKLRASADDSLLFWNRAATPVIGKGTKVNEIIVEDGPSGGNGARGFQVAIFSSHSGKPSKELVSASAHQPACGRVNVPISPITLKRGTKYWVVQRLSACCSGSNSMVWVYDKKRTHGALSQSGVSSSSGHGHRGRWKPLTGGVPYATVRESAGAAELNRPAQSRAASDRSLSQMVVPTRRASHEGSIPRYPP